MSGPRGATAALVAVLVLGACTAGPSATPVDQSPHRGGRLVHSIPALPRTLQPILDESVGLVTSLIYARLAIPDPKSGEMIPELARWEVGKDGLTYEWTMDARATWSDGTPITAQDWLTGLKAVGRSKRTTYGSAFSLIPGFADFSAGRADGIDGVQFDPADPKKWSVRYTQVYCAAVDQTSGFVLPAHVFGRYVAPGTGDAIDRAPENDAPPIASGPFTFAERREGDQIVLRRNDRYWKGAALLDEYIVKVVSDPTAAIAGLKTGETDHGSVGPDLVDAFKDDAAFDVRSVEGANYAFIGWNVRSSSAPALRDRRVRQALAYGLDVDTIIETVQRDRATRIHAPHTPASWAFTKDVTEYSYDPANANELLIAAGYERGKDGIRQRDGSRLAFTLRVPAGALALERIAQIAVEQYRQLGVEVRMVSEPLAVFQERLNSGDPEVEAWVFLWRPPQRADPDTEYLKFSSDNIADKATKRRGFNWSGYSDPVADASLLAARTPPDGDCSMSTRRRHYEVFGRRLNEDQPNLFLYAPHVSYVTSSRVRGFEPGPWGAYWNVERWWMAP